MAKQIGDWVHVPDRHVNAWGKLAAIEGPNGLVVIAASATTRSSRRWYRLEDLQTNYERRKARRGRPRA